MEESRVSKKGASDGTSNHVFLLGNSAVVVFFSSSAGIYIHFSTNEGGLAFTLTIPDGVKKFPMGEQTFIYPDGVTRSIEV